MYNSEPSSFFNYIYKLSVIIVVLISIYFILLRPIRMIFNERVLSPILSKVFHKNEEVFIPKDNPFAVIIEKSMFGKLVKVKTPFGKWWFIPFCFLLSLKSRELAKKLTFYHVILTFIIPILLLLFLEKVNSEHWFIISSITEKLDLLIGLSFTTFGFKILNEYRALFDNQGYKAV